MTTLKKGGRIVSTARGDIAALCADGVVCIPRSAAHGQPRSVLEEVSSLAESGKLTVRVDKTFPLSEAAQAQQYGEQGNAAGKIILIVDSDKANAK
jgi:NADPH:quinone reductase-like Zn-dependent oxidoreductase